MQDVYKDKCIREQYLETSEIIFLLEMLFTNLDTIDVTTNTNNNNNENNKVRYKISHK